MAELPYMPIPIAEAIADAEGLTNEQLGALERVRRKLWYLIEPGTLAPMLSVEDVVRVSRLGKRWGMAGPGLMRRLQVSDDGMVSCPVINDRLALTRKRRKQKVDAAAISVAMRGTAGARKSSSEGARKPRNPLRGHALDSDLLGPSLQRAGSNQNHNSYQTAENIPGISTGLSDEEVKTKQDALYRDGVKLLMEKTGVTRLQATKNLNAWLGMLDGDADATAALLGRADAENFTGHTFSVMVAKWAEQIERERTKGFSLNFPPVAVSGGAR